MRKNAIVDFSQSQGCIDIVSMGKQMQNNNVSARSQCFFFEEGDSATEEIRRKSLRPKSATKLV